MLVLCSRVKAGRKRLEETQRGLARIPEAAFSLQEGAAPAESSPSLILHARPSPLSPPHLEQIVHACALVRDLGRSGAEGGEVARPR